MGISSCVDGICYGCDDDSFGHNDDDCICGQNGLVNNFYYWDELSLKIWRILDKRMPQNKHF